MKSVLHGLIEMPARVTEAGVTAFFRGLTEVIHGHNVAERRRQADEYGRELSDPPPATPRNRSK